LIRSIVGPLSAAVLLVACSAPGMKTASPGEVAERPAADQPVTTEVRRVARAHVELGTAYLQASKMGTAMEEARLAIAIDPAYAPGYHLLGQVHMFLEEKDAAQKAFDAALARAPGDPDINNTYGWFLCVNGREQDGLAMLAKSAQNPFNTTPTRPLTNSGLCYLRLKDEKNAADRFAKALQADPTNSVAAYQLGEIAFHQGDYARARDLATELNQNSEPTPESVWLGLRAERKLGNQEAEATYVAQLRNKFRSSKQYQDYLAGRFE
jgi:type IV pilus assembly protein PilF